VNPVLATLLLLTSAAFADEPSVGSVCVYAAPEGFAVQINDGPKLALSEKHGTLIDQLPLNQKTKIAIFKRGKPHSTWFTTLTADDPERNVSFVQLYDNWHERNTARSTPEKSRRAAATARKKCLFEPYEMYM